MTQKDKVPYGFSKISLLNIEGQTLVWLGKSALTGQILQLKQIQKSNHNEFMKANREVAFQKEVYRNLGYNIPKDNNLMCNLQDPVDDEKEFWLIYEYQGQNLHDMMYYIEPREKMGIQTFVCQHNMLNKLIKKDSQFLRTIVLKVAEALDQMHSLNYIHCNLKLQNVVVKLDDFQKIEQVKLTGFGDVF